MENGIIMQCFEWNLPADKKLWKNLAKMAESMSEIGITAVWLPPAYKGASGINDVGYGVYDLYDLGEFNQKGAIATKYGTKKDYLLAINAFHNVGINVYGDIVLNHKLGADEVEEVQAEEFNENSRNQMIGESRTIGAWTKFDFSARKNKYSKFKWNWKHFDGIDWDQNRAAKKIFKFSGKQWDSKVDDEKGNYDYLMGADVDFSNPEIIEEMDFWGKWYIDFTNIDGLRLDAVKHISKDFMKNWIHNMRMSSNKELFAVAEYWHWDVNELKEYLNSIEYSASLFDVPLHNNFHNCSNANGQYDLRTIFDNTLVKECQMNAVTFVDNHDTQPGQALESWVKDWFKPMAYALILLRENGYPCVFYGDYYGLYDGKSKGIKAELDKIMLVRKEYAYGIQHDYLDDPDVIGWTREGEDEKPNSAVAVVISDGTGGTKRMYIGKQHSGSHFIDAMGNAKYNIKIDDEGCGEFYVNRCGVAVWVKKHCK